MWKALLLASNAIASNVVLTPPNPPPKHEELAKYKGSSERFPHMFTWLGFMVKLTVFFMNLVEVLTILSTASKWVSSSRVMSEVTRVGANIHVTPTFLAASALICGAAFIRTSCYRYLGRQFTFELALQKDHKLVTGGPYSIVRHPSYIGSLMYIAGSMLILVDHGSLWAQVGLWETTHGQLMRACIAAMAAFSTFIFVRRTWLEDEILSREFGDEWLAWSKRTPYKLIPYIF